MINYEESNMSKVEDYRVEENELLGVVSLQEKKVHAKYVKIYDP